LRAPERVDTSPSTAGSLPLCPPLRAPERVDTSAQMASSRPQRVEIEQAAL
jgi:hypothetical protein